MTNSNYQPFDFQGNRLSNSVQGQIQQVAQGQSRMMSGLVASQRDIQKAFQKFQKSLDVVGKTAKESVDKKLVGGIVDLTKKFEKFVNDEEKRAKRREAAEKRREAQERGSKKDFKMPKWIGDGLKVGATAVKGILGWVQKLWKFILAGGILLNPEAIGKAIKAISDGVNYLRDAFKGEEFKKGIGVLINAMGEIAKFSIKTFTDFIKGLGNFAEAWEKFEKGDFLGALGELKTGAKDTAAGLVALAALLAPTAALRTGLKGLTAILKPFTRTPPVQPTGPGVTPPRTQPGMPMTPRTPGGGPQATTPGGGPISAGGFVRGTLAAVFINWVYQNTIGAGIQRGFENELMARLNALPPEEREIALQQMQASILNEQKYQQTWRGQAGEALAGISGQPSTSQRLIDLYSSVLRRMGVEGYQTGGVVVPGSGDGDSVPGFLAPGSFVLNREATLGYQAGGLIPTLLEPGEMVFGPGQWGAREMALNSAIPRFQQGGQVSPGGQVSQSDASSARGGSEPRPPSAGQVRPQPPSTSGDSAVQVDEGATGTAAIISAAEKSIGIMAGIAEQCANSTRAVLKVAGHPAWNKATKKGDLDPEGLKYNGLGFAASFAGSDMGTVKTDISAVKAGDVMLWRDTYGNFAPGAITHVGLAGEGNTQYDHGSGPGWRKRSRSSLANKFAYGITLGGQASGENIGNDGVDVSGGGSFNPFAGLGAFSAMWDAIAPIRQMFGGFAERLFGGSPANASTNVEPAASDPESLNPTDPGTSDASAEYGKWGPVLSVIAKGESGNLGWNAMYPGTTLPGAVQMTMTQVAKAATGAVGKYQNLPRYIVPRAKAIGLNPMSALYNAQNQTKIAEYLIGPGQANVTIDMAKNNPKQAMARLSRVWAAIPKDDSGASYYAGDGVNAAKITPAEMYAAFKKLQTGGPVTQGIAPARGSNATYNMMSKGARNAGMYDGVNPPVIVMGGGAGGGGSRGSAGATSNAGTVVPALRSSPQNMVSADYFNRMCLGRVLA